MKVNLCLNCKHMAKVEKPSKRAYSICKKLTPEERQTPGLTDNWVICINAREEGGECGPEGKFWER